jgi:cytochrome P450
MDGNIEGEMGFSGRWPLILPEPNRIAKSVTAERFKPGAPDHHDMLASFIRHGLIQDEAANLNESLTQIAAGNDTSVTPIRFVMLYILSNPNVYQKLQAEIDDAIALAKISSPSRRSKTPKRVTCPICRLSSERASGSDPLRPLACSSRCLLEGT